MSELVKYDEESCLSVNPFEGDFGEPGDKTLSNKIVTLRKSRTCDMCGRSAKVGTRCRVQANVFAGEFKSYTWCEDCCAAMAYSWTDQGRALTRRTAMGNS